VRGWNVYPAALVVLGAVLAAAGGSLAAGTGTPRPAEEALGLAAALAGLVILSWWTAALLLALAAELLRRRGRSLAASVVGAMTPGFMRRLAAALLGAQLLAVPAGAQSAPPDHGVRLAVPLAAGTPAPAAAPPPDRELQAAGGLTGRGGITGDTRDAAGENDRGNDGVPEPADSPARAPRVSPEWVPRPVPCGPGLLAREPARQAHDARPAEVVVRTGDSLWSIAAARLGPLASDAEIAGSWPRWYARNAPVIGPDPGLLRPGQVLSAPEP
jgi:hypothetical protein